MYLNEILLLSKEKEIKNLFNIYGNICLFLKKILVAINFKIRK